MTGVQTCALPICTVTGKRVEGGRHLVDITQEARNQDGELSVIGTGTVELPAKGKA